MKNKNILIVFIVAILVICIGLVIYNFTLNKNKIAKVEEVGKTLTTDDGVIKTKEHLAQMETTSQELENFKKQISDIAIAKGQTPVSNSSEDIAQAVNNIKTGKTIVKIGTFSREQSNSITFNVSTYPGYKNFTVNNFLLEFVDAKYVGAGSPISSVMTWNAEKSYNASTGVFTLAGTYKVYSSTAASGVGGNIYLIY